MSIQGIKKEAYTQEENTVFSHGISVTLHDNNFTISKFNQQEESPDIDWDGDPEFSVTLSVDNIKTDSISKATISDHSAVVVVKDKVFDYFRSSLATRATAISSVVGNDNSTNYVVFVIPFADSSTDDWKVLCNGDLKLNGSAVTDTYSGDTLNKALEFLPTITVTESEGTVTATVSPSKENVEVYFESTVGQLSASRAITNSSGQAFTTITNGAGGKVKAGFKFYPGKDEVNI
jgi:hypothetical protein